jgi:hypothetical protein
MTRLAIEDELRSLGGKTKALKLGERDAKDLAGRLEQPNGIETALRSEPGRENQRKPCEAVIVDQGCERSG